MTMFLSPYAAYVWSAYVITLGGLLITIVLTLRAWRKAKQTLADREKPVEGSETNL